MKHAIQPLQFTLVVLVVIAALCAILASCDDHHSEQPAVPHIAGGGEVVLGPSCPGNPFDSVGVRHNLILHDSFSRLVQENTADDDLDVALRGVLDDVMSVFGPGTSSLIDSGWSIAASISVESAAAYIPPGLPAAEQAALADMLEAITTHKTAVAQKRALCDLEASLVGQGWPLADGTGQTALASVSVAKHSSYFWNWVFADSGFEKTVSGMEKPLRDKIIIADAMAFAMACGSSFSLNQPNLGGKLISGIIAGGTASAAVVIIAKARNVVDFFKRLFN